VPQVQWASGGEWAFVVLTLWKEAAAAENQSVACLSQTREEMEEERERVAVNEPERKEEKFC
jgi:hypothetical protein